MVHGHSELLTKQIGNNLKIADAALLMNEMAGSSKLSLDASNKVSHSHSRISLDQTDRLNQNNIYMVDGNAIMQPNI